MMQQPVWRHVYHGPVDGDCLHGLCAACEYDGVSDDFEVWSRGGRLKMLCAQCSGDVRETMLHEGWLRVGRDSLPPDES